MLAYLKKLSEMWLLVELNGARITLLVVLFFIIEFWVDCSFCSRNGSSPAPLLSSFFLL